MELNDYQKQAQRTSAGQSEHTRLLLRFLGVDGPAASVLAHALEKPGADCSRAMRTINAGLGLAGEAGEVADHLKKVATHGHELDLDKLVEEGGDVLWYLAELFSAHGVSLEEVARRNLAKLARRYPQGFSSEASINRVALPAA